MPRTTSGFWVNGSSVSNSTRYAPIEIDWTAAFGRLIEERKRPLRWWVAEGEIPCRRWPPKDGELLIFHPDSGEVHRTYRGAVYRVEEGRNIARSVCTREWRDGKMEEIPAVDVREVLDLSAFREGMGRTTFRLRRR